MKILKSTIKNILDGINGSFNIAEESELTVIKIETFQNERRARERERERD